MKPTATPVWSDLDGVYKQKRRKINRALERFVKGYNNIEVINVDPRQPGIDSCFDYKGNLSGHSFAKFWYFIDQKIKKFNTAAKSYASSKASKN